MVKHMTVLVFSTFKSTNWPASASLTTWTTQLTTVEKRAAEHERFAVELVQQIADPIKNVSIRYEELRKSHVEFAGKLEKEKDAAFGIVQSIGMFYWMTLMGRKSL